jgi:hypothetical protein
LKRAGPPTTSAHPSAQPSSDTAEKRASRYRSGGQTIDRSSLLPYILPIHHIIPQSQIKNQTFFKKFKKMAPKKYFLKIQIKIPSHFLCTR